MQGFCTQYSIGLYIDANCPFNSFYNSLRIVFFFFFSYIYLNIIRYCFSRYTIVAGYYGLTLAVRVSVCRSVRQYFRFLVISSVNINGFSCIKPYEHSCLKLFLNGPEAVFKQQKSMFKSF